MRRTLFIDGSNLYGGLTDLLKPGEYFDFAELLEILEEDLFVTGVMFYGTFMKIDSSKPNTYRLRVLAQKAFFNSAKNHPKVTFYQGHFSGAGKEKGVDVRLAVDMAVGAAINEYDEAIIMSGDADLQYCVEKAVDFRKKVYLAALASRFPFGTAVLVERRFIYDIRGFFLNNILPEYRGKRQGLRIRELLDTLEIKKVK